MASLDIQNDFLASTDGLMATRPMSCARTPIGICLDSFFEKCLSEEADDSSNSWGEEASMSVKDVEILARPSSEVEEVPQPSEQIALLVMANDEQHTWLQVKSLGTTTSNNVHNAIESLTTMTESTNAVQFMSAETAVTRSGMPVAGVGLLSQQLAAIADDVQAEDAEAKQVLVAKFVQRCSRRQKLKKDQAEVCPICLDSMTKSQHVQTLPCFHRLHDRCSAKYFKTAGVKPMCPVCRFDMAALP